jgi:hypothetical protein
MGEVGKHAQSCCEQSGQGKPHVSNASSFHRLLLYVIEKGIVYFGAIWPATCVHRSMRAEPRWFIRASVLVWLAAAHPVMGEQGGGLYHWFWIYFWVGLENRPLAGKMTRSAIRSSRNEQACRSPRMGAFTLRRSAAKNPESALKHDRPRGHSSRPLGRTHPHENGSTQPREHLVRCGSARIFIRHRSSTLAPPQLPDLIGIKDRRYLEDKSGLQLASSL